MTFLSYTTDNSIHKTKHRITFTIIVIVGVFSILLSRVWFLQVVKGKEYQVLSEGNRIRLKRLRAPRGMIVDRNQNILVQNRPSFTVSIVPEDVKDMDNVLSALSSLINKPAEEMKCVIKNSKTLPFESISLKHDLSFQEVAVLEEHRNDLPGVTVEVTEKRYYPYETAAAHLLGYTGEISLDQLKKEEFKYLRPGDLIGQSGLERVENAYLMGVDGGKQVEVDAEGRELSTLGYLSPVPGHNITLTIDLALQKRAEEMLGEMCGAVVAMDPQNGKILALVSHPSFNPNHFAIGISRREWQELLDNPKDPLQNRAIMAHYPPGSIFKIVVASAGLERDVIDEWSSLYCNGSIKLGAWTFFCWKKKGHGSLALHEAIVHSCNVFFYQVGSKLGIDAIAEYARDFGFGNKTGIILPGENPGLIPDTKWKKRTKGANWFPGETITASIGQGYILVTPIQLACFISAVGNGGSLYYPQLLEKIETHDGEIIEKYTPALRRKVHISPANLQIVRYGLRGVVNEHGTGWRAAVPGIEVAGKTGTAQVVKLKKQGEDDDESGAEENTPEHLRDHAWFVAFAPFQNPEIAVVVFVEHGGHGGYTCAPIAQEMIRAYVTGDYDVDR